jgi:cation:H+ antiporter
MHSVLAAGHSAPDIVFLFAGAGLVLYIASRAAADAVTSIKDPSPGRMALAQWMPIAWTAILATAVGRSDIGLGVTFATSVAAVGLTLGTLLLLATHSDASVPNASAWPFVIPAAMLALMAGFSGQLTWWHALMMLAAGAAVWAVWRGAAAAPEKERALEQRPDSKRLRTWQLIISIALGAVGAWLAYQAARVADERTRVATGGLIATAVLGPLLVLPLLGTGAFAAQNGRLGAAMGTIVGVVLLNLCLLLPMVVLIAYARQFVGAWIDGERDFAAMREQIKPVFFPIAPWRLDTVLIIVAGLMLVPVSLGRWTLHRAEGVAMTVFYVAYIVASTYVAIRS